MFGRSWSAWRYPCRLRSSIGASPQHRSACFVGDGVATHGGARRRRRTRRTACSGCAALGDHRQQEMRVFGPELIESLGLNLGESVDHGRAWRVSPACDILPAISADLGRATPRSVKRDTVGGQEPARPAHPHRQACPAADAHSRCGYAPGAQPPADTAAALRVQPCARSWHSHGQMRPITVPTIEPVPVGHGEAQLVPPSSHSHTSIEARTTARPPRHRPRRRPRRRTRAHDAAGGRTSRSSPSRRRSTPLASEPGALAPASSLSAVRGFCGPPGPLLA